MRSREKRLVSCPLAGIGFNNQSKGTNSLAGWAGRLCSLRLSFARNRWSAQDREGGSLASLMC